MTTFLVPVILVICAVVLIALIGYNETKLREEEPPQEPTDFERHQQRVREARTRAQWRAHQRMVDKERSTL